MTDIVERLRGACWERNDPEISGIMLEAAAQIERARLLIAAQNTRNLSLWRALNCIASKETKTLEDAQAIAFGALTVFA